MNNPCSTLVQSLFKQSIHGQFVDNSWTLMFQKGCAANKVSPLMSINCLIKCPINRRVKETKSQRDKGSKRRREEETKGREDENRVTSYSPPIHLLFVSSSPPLHRPIRSNLFNSCPKTFARFVSKTVLHQRTPLCESSVKVKVGGKLWEWEAQERRRHSDSRCKGRGCAVNLNYNTASSNNVFVRNPHIFIFHMTSFI